MLKIQAMEIIGGDLSATSKMPCKSLTIAFLDGMMPGTFKALSILKTL
jgi:hypothetical protein